ncbi:fibronectin type III domain-containing protein [Melioribacteraceae bacterium 4301-Me]|uniref:fibronectin type III domain-containing protein n=1 Tax=Pyranulibacter aquaticus TaxID=3163344 RepID=UPI003599B280
MFTSLKKAMYLKFKYVMLISLFFYLLSCERQQVTESEENNLPPDTPVGLEVYTAHDGFVSIDWLPNTESNIKGYNIYRSINDTSRFKLLSFTKDNYYLDINLDYDSTYFYRISALNNKNIESLESNYVSAKPSNLYPPSSPYSIYINARNWNDTISIVLIWNKPPDYDIAFYQIYRDTLDNFLPNQQNYIASTNQNNFSDTKNLKLLKTYFYKIVTVDKGNLKSNPSITVSDKILDLPELISPPNNSNLDSMPIFQFKTVSEPANYKLVIQTNELFGIVSEISFSSNKKNAVISVPVSNLYLEEARKYYWRVFTYTVSQTDPNSFSKLFSFTYNPTY